jgi:CheY-like chemotaxis protein
MLSVQDTGEGMDAATLERIFEPFFTTKAMNRGTGLGLATVYGIIKQSGGHIVVDSHVGRGTTFRIYLPSVAADVHPDAPGPNESAAGGRETILIVEDELDVSEFARDALVLYGYTVLSATSPNEALAIARRRRDDIDVVLTDVVMPGMSGRELANRIAEICPRARVAYMSGYTEDAIVRRGVHSAEIPFIAKPFTADSLAYHLRTVLDGEPVAAGR